MHPNTSDIFVVKKGRFRRPLLIAAALLLMSMFAWVLVPPYPSPVSLMDKSFATLTASLGHPSRLAPTEIAVWQKSRGVAVWSLEVGYNTAPIEPTTLPQNISRSLRIVWPDIAIPYGYSARARLMVPNTALKGSRAASVP
jgi:hypothetical protein